MCTTLNVVILLMMSYKLRITLDAKSKWMGADFICKFVMLYAYYSCAYINIVDLAWL